MFRWRPSEQKKVPHAFCHTIPWKAPPIITHLTKGLNSQSTENTCEGVQRLSFLKSSVW